MTDGRVIALVNKMLKAKVMDSGKLMPTTVGIPQGNAASPILANILLNEVDQELERRGHRFVRYADDMMIFCKSKRAAFRVLESITKFIEGKMLLQVNKEKTTAAHLTQVKFLGFGFYKNPKEGQWSPTVHKKSRQKLLEKMKEILDRRCPKGIEDTITLLKQVVRGWANYFSPAIKTARQTACVDGRIRRRIRQLLLKAWKRKWTRFQKMKEILASMGKTDKPGIGVAFSSQGYWAQARLSQLVLTNEWLASQGWTWVARELKFD